MQQHQLINQDSGNTEYYTPSGIIEAARLVMGGIDLDPASSAVANQRVQATRFFCAEDDALTVPWNGRVWMNHPFSRENNPRFVRKLIEEYTSGRVSSACCITFAATSEAWFRPLLAHPQCYIYGRTNYYLPDGTLKKGVSKGSVVTYLGDNEKAFREVFKQLGAVKV